MIYRQYNPGRICERRPIPYRLWDYLCGVSLARQSINLKLPAVVRNLRGVVLDIGGARGTYDADATNANIVVADIFRRPQNHITADAGALPISTGTLGGILCISVLEHADEPFRLITEANRVLVAGGVLFLSVPWLFETHMEPHDYWRFSQYQLQKWADETGFIVENITPANGRLGLVAHFVQSTAILRWTLGLPLVLLDSFRTPSSRFASQLTVILRKPGAIGGPQPTLEDSLVCPSCHESKTMKIKVNVAHCTKCQSEIINDENGGFIFHRDTA